MSSGIYQILNTVNDIRYIGSAENFKYRWAVHRSDFKRGKNSAHLQNAYNKYGEENFVFSVIEYVENKEDLVPREQHYIDLYDFGRLYNINPIAGSRLGSKATEETRKKMSKAKKGWVGYWLGKKRSPETIKKISIANKGKKRSEETKKKIGQAVRGKTKGHPQYNTGRTHFKKGHTTWNKDKKMPEETRRKCSDVSKGKHYSPETEFKKGHKRTRESIEKGIRTRQVNKFLREYIEWVNKNV